MCVSFRHGLDSRALCLTLQDGILKANKDSTLKVVFYFQSAKDKTIQEELQAKIPRMLLTKHESTVKPVKVSPHFKLLYPMPHNISSALHVLT